MFAKRFKNLNIIRDRRGVILIIAMYWISSMKHEVLIQLKQIWESSGWETYKVISPQGISALNNVAIMLPCIDIPRISCNFPTDPKLTFIQGIVKNCSICSFSGSWFLYWWLKPASFLIITIFIYLNWTFYNTSLHDVRVFILFSL